MSLPFDTGDELLDRQKSGLYLYYIARATRRVKKREIAHRKVEMAINQLKKLSTRDLHKHIDELQMHVKEAVHSEKQILGNQKEEEGVHAALQKKMHVLDKKLSKYLHSQDARKKRIMELEQKVKVQFTSKRDKIKALQEDVKRLSKLYNKAKKSRQHKKADLVKIKNRISALRDQITILR